MNENLYAIQLKDRLFSIKDIIDPISLFRMYHFVNICRNNYIVLLCNKINKPNVDILELKMFFKLKGLDIEFLEDGNGLKIYINGIILSDYYASANNPEFEHRYIKINKEDIYFLYDKIGYLNLHFTCRVGFYGREVNMKYCLEDLYEKYRFSYDDLYEFNIVELFWQWENRYYI